MVGVLEKRLAVAIDRRLAVFQGKLRGQEAETELRAMAFLISELVQPCCCMLCNRQKLEELLELTAVCKDRPELKSRLAELVYHDLARCNGLG